MEGNGGYRMERHGHQEYYREHEGYYGGGSRSPRRPTSPRGTSSPRGTGTSGRKKHKSTSSGHKKSKCPDGTRSGSSRSRNHHRHRSHTSRSGVLTSLTDLSDATPNTAALVIAILLALSAFILICVGIWLLAERLGWPVGLNFADNTDWTRTLSVGNLILIIGLLMAIVVGLGFVLVSGGTALLRTIAVFLSAIVFTLLFVLAVLCIIFAANTVGWAADFLSNGWEKTKRTIPSRLCTYQRDNKCYGYEDGSCRGCDVTAQGQYTAGCTEAQRRTCPICVSRGSGSRTLMVSDISAGSSLDEFDTLTLIDLPGGKPLISLLGRIKTMFGHGGMERTSESSWERLLSFSNTIGSSGSTRVAFVAPNGRPGTRPGVLDRTAQPEPTNAPRPPEEPCKTPCDPAYPSCKKGCPPCPSSGCGGGTTGGGGGTTGGGGGGTTGGSTDGNGTVDGTAGGAGLFTQYADHGCRQFIEEDFRQFMIPFAVYAIFLLVLVFLLFAFLCCVQSK